MTAPGGSIELWFSPPGPEGLESFAAEGRGILSPEETVRLAAFGSADAAGRFLAGRVMMRRILGERLNVPPETIDILIDEAGKPVSPAASAAGLSFNLSHDGDDVVLAVSDVGAVGVDIVAASRGEQAARVAPSYFHADEIREIAGAEQEDPLRALKFWALKESAGKALGLSVWKAAGTFAFRLDGGPGGGETPAGYHAVGLYESRCVVAVSCIGSADVAITVCRRCGDDRVLDMAFQVAAMRPPSA